MFKPGAYCAVVKIYQQHDADQQRATGGGLTFRHLALAMLLVFTFAQPLALQHFHAADDLGVCVICIHGDHNPIADPATPNTPAVDHTIDWSISPAQTSAIPQPWPAFQSRAPPERLTT